MPTYTYRDTNNGEQFEYKQSMNDEALEYWPEDVPGYDPNNQRPVKRVIGGGTGFILKGSGWYKSDYASESKSQPSIDNSKDSTSKSSDNKSSKSEDKASASASN